VQRSGDGWASDLHRSDAAAGFLREWARRSLPKAEYQQVERYRRSLVAIAKKGRKLPPVDTLDANMAQFLKAQAQKKGKKQAQKKQTQQPPADLFSLARPVKARRRSPKATTPAKETQRSKQGGGRKVARKAVCTLPSFDLS
jgi:hypothetical protein